MGVLYLKELDHKKQKMAEQLENDKYETLNHLKHQNKGFENNEKIYHERLQQKMK